VLLTLLSPDLPLPRDRVPLTTELPISSLRWQHAPGEELVA